MCEMGEKEMIQSIQNKNRIILELNTEVHKLKTERLEIQAALRNFKLNGSNEVEQIRGIYADLEDATNKIRELVRADGAVTDSLRFSQMYHETVLLRGLVGELTTHIENVDNLDALKWGRIGVDLLVKVKGVLDGDVPAKEVPKTVGEMVGIWLKDNGYDGLYRPDECACKLDDLMPCGETNSDCEAGYLGTCKDESASSCYGDCDFHIGPKKE